MKKIIKLLGTLLTAGIVVAAVFKKLHKKHKNVSILYREGNKKEVGKSINHLHIHLIPNIQIGSITLNAKKREIYSEENYIEKIKELKKIF